MRCSACLIFLKPPRRYATVNRSLLLLNGSISRSLLLLALHCMRCTACAAVSLSSLKPPRRFANVNRSLLLLKKIRRAVQKARRKHHQVAQGQGHLAAPPRPRRALLHVRLRELRGRSWAVGQLGSCSRDNAAHAMQRLVVRTPFSQHTHTQTHRS